MDPKAWTPSSRYEGFSIYENSDGTYHIMVVSDDGPYVFADRLPSFEEATWTAALLNAAIGAKQAGTP